jgi:fumarate hydratase subunit alpha
MRAISTLEVGDAVRGLFLDTAVRLSPELGARLALAAASEASPMGRMVLGRLAENANLAGATGTPLCQDTGLAQIAIDLGQEVALAGPPLAESVEAAVRGAYEDGRLRKSTCHPLTRANLGGNVPASLEVAIVPGDRLTIRTLAKGGGCDNKSALVNLPPTAGPEALRRTVVELVERAGPDACPPFCLGLCVGGSFESAPRLARRALMDLWGDPPMTAEELDLAGDLLERINSTGLGPLGLGGRVTALGLRVKIHPAHLASLPVALNVNCHSFRAGRAVI